MIAGITVSVGYADYLAKTIGAWQSGLDQLIVVTSPEDIDTRRVCINAGAACYACPRFFSGGAYFNKAAGLNLAAKFIRPDNDWVLAFDADILPPPNWRDWLWGIERGTLYGAERGELDPLPAGWLMLFHAGDPGAARRPLFVEYNNASGYDTEFAGRWASLRWLPFDVKHLGKPGENWCGRGRSDAMRALLLERGRRGGFEHERMVQA